MKLAMKFTLAFLAGLGLVLAGYGYAISQHEIAHFEISQKRNQSLLGYAIALAVASEWENSGEQAALSFVERANRSERQNQITVRWVWLDAPLGSPDAPRLSPSKLAALRDNQEVAATDKREGEFGFLRTYYPVTISGRGIGAVEVTESLQEQRLHIRQTLRYILIATAAAAVLSMSLAALLGYRMVGRPITQLIERSRAVAAGDLSVRLHFRQHDELAELAVVENTMCEHLTIARERVAAETAARIATIEQLRHADRLKTVGQLASGVAHELGTPLNVVRARAQMITAEVPAESSSANNARIVVQQADRMTGIIRQLLDFARPRPPRHIAVDLSQLVQQTFNLLASMAEKRRVHMSLNADVELKAVKVDPDQLQQVLSNLLLNGIQAMPDGGDLTVEITQTMLKPPVDHGGPKGEYLCVSVRDQGVGIVAENLPRLFEPFFTTKQVGEGTGLGLSVSRGIITEHGGWIDVTSQVGQGACFRVYLPLALSAG